MWTRLENLGTAPKDDAAAQDLALSMGDLHLRRSVYIAVLEDEYDSLKKAIADIMGIRKDEV